MKIKTYFKKFSEVILLNLGFVKFLGKRKTGYFLILAILTSFFNSVNYIALIPLVSVVIDGGSGNKQGMFSSVSRFLPFSSLSIYAIGAIVVTAFVLKFLMNILFAHLAGHYAENYMFFLRRRMMKTMASDYYQSGIHAPSQIMHFNNMITRVGSFNWASFSMISKGISSAFLFASLFLVEYKLAAFSILFVVFWASVLMPVLKYTRKVAAEYAVSLHRVQIFLKDEIEGKEIIQIFSLGETRAQKLSELQKDAVYGNAALSDIRAVVANLQEFIVVIVGVVLLCFAHAYQLEIGYLVAYGYVFSKFISNLNEVTTYLNNALEVMPPTKEILEYVKPEDVNFESYGLNRAEFSVSQLTFRDVQFAWAGTPLFSLNELSLAKGDRVIITGKNGVGKSTFLKVMAGLIRSNGTMQLNGQTPTTLGEIRKLHQRVSYIPQNGVVFEGSLVENILLNSGKTVEDIRHLMQKLDIDLAEYFAHWESFKIQEDGNNLSGGEMQIISIFRALIRDSDILFIDEFSNHLSERVIKKVDRYFSEMNDKILVCVTHSQFTFPNKKILIEDGTVSLL